MACGNIGDGNGSARVWLDSGAMSSRRNDFRNLRGGGIVGCKAGKQRGRHGLSATAVSSMDTLTRKAMASGAGSSAREKETGPGVSEMEGEREWRGAAGNWAAC